MMIKQSQETGYPSITGLKNNKDYRLKPFVNSTILSAVGNTPIVKLNKIASGVNSDIYAKLEFMNPGGSIKDRAGIYMCQQASSRGELAPGGIIVESTSGNTGVGVCLYGNSHDHPCVVVMTDKQSREKMAYLKAFGAKVIICPSDVAPDDPRSYCSVAARVASKLGALYLNQNDNPDNRECHYLQTGPEIYQQTGGEFDILVAAVGTGGTISGIGRYLKERNPAIQVVGVDCVGSVIAGFARTGKISGQAHYHLEGLGGNIIPTNIDFDVIDHFEITGDNESFRMTKELLLQEGIYAGGSSGAAVLGALNYVRNLSEVKRVLVILPDSGNRYATKIYNDHWLSEQGFQETRATDALDSQIRGLLQKEVVLV